MTDCAFFFFNDTATTEIYTLSLHDALPISGPARPGAPGRRPGRNPGSRAAGAPRARLRAAGTAPDRKSTRLNSSHANISYAVFCLKKKNLYYTSVIYHVILIILARITHMYR